MLKKRETNCFVILLCCIVVSIPYWYLGNQFREETVIRIWARSPINGKVPNVGVENTTIEVDSKVLAREVRVLCLVITGTEPKNIKKIRAVKDTWGRRCNKLIIFSSQAGDDKSLGIVPLKNVSEGRNSLWAKTKQAFKYVWENHMDEADWFMKADDDTYVILENLRQFLKEHNPLEPGYFGFHLRQNNTNNVYASGGAGYVLSKEAVRRLIQEGLPDKKKCIENGEGSEDLQMGKCLKNVGVDLGDTRDELGRQRFMPMSTNVFIPPNDRPFPSWYHRLSVHRQVQGLECCSTTSISFHYISPENQYVLDFLIYYLHPAGIRNDYRNSFVTASEAPKVGDRVDGNTLTTATTTTATTTTTTNTPPTTTTKPTSTSSAATDPPLPPLRSTTSPIASNLLATFTPHSS